MPIHLLHIEYTRKGIYTAEKPLYNHQRTGFQSDPALILKYVRAKILKYVRAKYLQTSEDKNVWNSCDPETWTVLDASTAGRSDSVKSKSWVLNSDWT